MARMTADQILEKSVGRTGQDPKRVRAAMAHLVQTDPKFRVMRSGNTLFSYYNKGNGNVEFTIDSAEDNNQLLKSFKEFMQAMKIAKFKQGSFQFSDPRTPKLLTSAGIPNKIQPLPGGVSNIVVEF
jgi:hypothetical protein